jgi:hypothetical protein
MILKKKNSNLLAKDKFQRLCYLLAIIFWLFMWQDDFKYLNATSSLFSLKYKWLIFIPTTILLLQFIFNQIYLWAIIFVLVLAYTIYALYLTFSDIIERSGNHVKAIPWTLENLILYIFILGTFCFINWILYKMKPNKNKR